MKGFSITDFNEQHYRRRADVSLSDKKPECAGF